MTASEMKSYFNVRLDVLASYNAPGLTDAEINVFLNLGQDRVVETMLNNRNYDAIAELIDNVTGELTGSYTGINNAKTYTWANQDENFLTFINAVVKMSRSYPTMTDQWVECEKINSTIAYNFALNGFNKPWFAEPKIFMENNLIVVIHDAYNVMLASGENNLKFTYVRNPVRIDVVSPYQDCELKDFLHKDVVEIAARLAIDSFEDNNRRDRRE